MMWIDLLFMVVFALILSSILTWGFGWRHPARQEAAGTSLLFLFIILWLMMWAGSTWIPRWGPILMGTAWLDILIIGVIISLLIMAAGAPVRKPRNLKQAVEEEEETEAAALAVFGLFFWILIGGLLIAALVGVIR